MLIVSIMMGIVVTQLPAPGDTLKLKQESDRLVALLTLASDEAVIRGSELGFDIDKDMYSFYEFRDETEEWVVIEEAPFQSRQVDEAIELSLKLEGRKSIFETEGKVPPILLLSSGETTPFDLSVFHRLDLDSGYIIKSDGYNGFSVEDRPE